MGRLLELFAWEETVEQLRWFYVPWSQSAEFELNPLNVKLAGKVESVRVLLLAGEGKSQVGDIGLVGSTLNSESLQSIDMVKGKRMEGAWQ